MNIPTLYGIKNCDTMKKAFQWLESHNIAYHFHDYKKEGLEEFAFNIALQQYGWEEVINRRGTTWHKLPDDVKNNMDAKRALMIAKKSPSIVKRPLLIYSHKAYLGLKKEGYASLFIM